MKKLVSSLLVVSMICGVVVTVFAEKRADNMDKVLSSVKNRIKISSDYKEFSSDSYTDENGLEYTFLWENGDKSTEVTANENGIISSYIYTESKDVPGEKISDDALYKAACGYVKKLNPDIYDNLKITAATGAQGLATFDIQRIENNIPVDGNSGYVAVSSDGKTLKNFYLNYAAGVKFEKVNKVISRDIAQKAYTDEIGFSLCYGSSYVDNKIIAVPIYTTNDEDMKYISAASGKPIKLNDISYVYETES